MTLESPERPSRVEQEVREILRNAEAQRSPMERLNTSVRQQTGEARKRVAHAAPSSPRSRYLTPELMRIVGALVLALLAALLGDVSRLLAIVAAIASLIMFFSLWFPSRRPTSIERPRWRGRDLV